MACILTAHIALSLVYATTIPWWESYDAPYHYSIARYISLNKSYPNSSQSKHYTYIPQFSLYYVLAGIAMSPIQNTDTVEPELNPGGAWRRIYLYDPTANTFPYQGTAAAVFMGRLVSIALGTLAIVCTWFIGRNLFPQRPSIALTAALLHAFWPLSTFIGSVVTNDIGVALAGSVMLWLISRLVASYRDARLKRHSPTWVAIGLAILAGMLSKNSGIALIGFALPLAILAFIQTCRRHPKLAAFIIIGLVILGLIIYFFPYGDYAPLLYLRVTAIRDAIFGGGVNNSPSLLSSLPTLISTKLLHPNLLRYVPDFIFGIFGSVSLFMPSTWYQIARVSVLLPVAGLLLAKRRGYAMRPIWLLGNAFFWVCFVAFMPSLLYNDFWQSFQARYFLPAWSALMLLIVIGLDSLPGRIRRPALLGVIGSICLVSLMTPIVVMHQAYSKPSFVADRFTYSYVPQVPVSLKFAEASSLGQNDSGNVSIELFGVSLAQGRLTIDPARLTHADDAESLKLRMQGTPMLELDWRALRKPDGNYRVKIDGIAANGDIIALLDAIPGYGKFATPKWNSGDQFRERIALPTQPLKAIRVQWLNNDTSQPLNSNCPQISYCEMTLPVPK